VHVVDTAGLRESTDEIEKIGIERAWEEIGAADAVLFLHDMTRADAMDYIAADAHIQRALDQKVSKSVAVIDVWNKADIADFSNAAVPPAYGGQDRHRPGLKLSAKTGAGLDALRRQLLDIAGWQAGAQGVFIARERHMQALARVDAHLALADAHLTGRVPVLDLLAEELRLAQSALNEITGEFTSDDLLGVIFSSFCIGK
jgi:tRNA modification GTPase